MRSNKAIFAALVVLSATSVVHGQVRRNGVWQGSDALRGNPHNLHPAVLHREPAQCGVTPLQQPRGVYNDASWENDIIPFVFSGNTTSSMRVSMLFAMEEVVRRTGVMFVERTDEPDYLFIQNDSENSSFVGRVGGAQAVKIFNWNFEFIMVHELMHAIGVWHEQSANDRDTFVTVFYENIEDGREHNFNIVPDANLSQYYDYSSVMHYGEFAFSISPGQLRTIVTTDPQFQSVIGQREFLSDGDIITLQDLHGGPTQTEWLSNGSLASTGDFLAPWERFQDAVAAVPNGGRIAVLRSPTIPITSPVVINKFVTINGGKLTVR